MEIDKIKIFNREKSINEEELVYADNFKKKIYGTAPGRILLELILKRRWMNRIYGLLQRTRSSQRKINQFVEKYNINIEEIELPVSAYRSLNDFFTRRLKPNARPIFPDPEALISPADSRLLVSKIDSEVQLTVKGKRYYFHELINDRELIQPYLNGLCLIFRLVPSDYHRFCYIDNGEQGPVIAIKGFYHASAPQTLITRNFPLYHQNYREYCILQTKNFGEVIQIEVGAMSVGSIRQKHRLGGEFIRGEEKGYFEYGGSTIILLLKPNTALIDDDIQFYSQQGIETLVKYGSRIGHKA